MQLVSNDINKRKETIRYVKDYSSESFVRQTTRGEKLTPKLQNSKKVYSLMGDEIMDLIVFKIVLKKIGD